MTGRDVLLAVAVGVLVTFAIYGFAAIAFDLFDLVTAGGSR